MTRQQRAIILADALLLGILAIWAGLRMEMDQLLLGGGVLVVASVAYWWVTR